MAGKDNKTTPTDQTQAPAAAAQPQQTAGAVAPAPASTTPSAPAPQAPAAAPAPQVPPDKPGNHSKLIAMLSALGQTLSATGTALATHGRQGGAKQISDWQAQQQEL